MARTSKQADERARSPRKRRPPSTKKTGARPDNLPSGFKEHVNALEGEIATTVFIPKIR